MLYNVRLCEEVIKCRLIFYLNCLLGIWKIFHITASAVYAVYTFVALLDFAEEFVTLEFEHHEFLLKLKLKRCGYLPAFLSFFFSSISLDIAVTWFLANCCNKLYYNTFTQLKFPHQVLCPLKLYNFHNKINSTVALQIYHTILPMDKKAETSYILK
jgi:hypothetical protein